MGLSFIRQLQIVVSSNTISENLYRVSGFDEISNACNPGYGGAVDDAFFESGNMS